ncbi:hypothetical protein HPULCUR_010729 [Helicostylum pulchrum]|uniref:Uncharacterized protein n=1 Tax=Helicostylum pulchrum TaxID=562976 RepID=A0ABP9YE27_9FUNG
MINLNTRITLPLKPALKFFATHNLSDWGFNAYVKYNDKPQKESKQRETYLVCLNDILLYNKDDDIERYVKELIKRVKAKLNKEHVPTFSQSVNYGSDCSFNGNVFHFNPHMKRNQEVEAGIVSDIQSTGQKSHCANTTFWPSQCYVFWDQTWFDEAEDISDAEDIYASEPEDEYEDESSSCYLIVPRIVAPFSRKILNILNLEEDKNSICKIVADYLTNHAISGWKYETVLRILIDHQLVIEPTKNNLEKLGDFHKRQLLDEDAINRFQQEQQDRQYQQDEQSSQAALIDNVKNMTPNERIAFLCDKFGNGGYLDLTEDRIARRFKKCLKETTYDLELGLQPMITKGEKEMLMKIADFKSREDIETMFLSSVCLTPSSTLQIDSLITYLCAGVNRELSE